MSTFDTTVPSVPVQDPSDWTPADLGDLESITFPWEQRHIDALEAAYDSYQEYVQFGAEGESLHPYHFAVPSLGKDLHALYNELLHGRGIVRMTGLPIERWSPEKIEAIYYGIGIHFGIPYVQSNLGDKVGYVENKKGQGGESRGYKSNRRLNMHTDPHDVLGMLCIRQALSGGDNTYVSAIAVYNTILRERPDLLPILQRGFRLHRFDGKLPTGEEVTRHRVPIFSFTDGVLSCHYLPDFIYLGAEALGEPLTEPELEALSFLDEVTRRPDLVLHLRPSPGDIVFNNDRTTLHSRTAFEDDPSSPRLFLRLVLLAFPGTARPVHENVIRWADRVDYARPAHSDYAGGNTDLKGDVLKSLDPAKF